MPASAGRTGWDFFVSYTSADQAWAEWIAWQLEKSGYRVLIQAWDFVPGAHWMTRMTEGVRTSRHVLAVLSEAYLSSVYGRKEWETAFQQDPDGYIRKVIPIRVQDCSRPDLLTGVVSFDLFDLPADQAERTLLDNIRIALAGRAKPATEPLFPGALIPPSSAARHSAAPAPALPLTAPAAPQESLDAATAQPICSAPDTAPTDTHSDLRQQLDEQTITLGPYHPNTLSTANNLAVTLLGLGNHQAARDLAQDTLIRQRQTLGNDHPHTLATERTLSRIGEQGSARAGGRLASRWRGRP